MKKQILQMIDIYNPEVGVEVLISETGTKLWVNVDGICRLRIYGSPAIVINDKTKEEKDSD